MTDISTLERAPWLEAHDEFEGVGAHELNPRYEHVDGGGWDQALAELGQPVVHTPALLRARALVAQSIRFDGPDVAHYQYDQAPIDWPAVARAPAVWGATKLTQSIRYLDPTANRSRLSMNAVGIRHRGLYHWLSSTTDVGHQAVWFQAQVGVLTIGEFAMIDAEEAGITVDMVVAWCELVEAATRRPCAVYTGAFVAGGTIWQSPRVRISRWGLRPMILAAYTTEARARALPGVAANPWHSWQYSSNGPVPGVTGRCDMNRVDDSAIYDLAAGITSVVVEPPTPPTPVIPGESNQEEPVQQLYRKTNKAAVWLGDRRSRSHVASIDTVAPLEAEYGPTIPLDPSADLAAHVGKIVVGVDPGDI